MLRFLGDYCPICDRRLPVNPSAECCPSCGQRVDRRALVIEAGSRSMFAVLVVALGLLALAAPGRRFGRWEPGELTALALCLLAVWLGLPRPRRRAVVDGSGVVLVGREDRPERFTWPEAAIVRWSPDGRSVDLLSASGVLMTRIEVGFFGTRGRARQFLAAVRRQRPVEQSFPFQGD